MILADVRVFVAIVNAGGLTPAARVLRLPKSSVARQLSRLERMLGARLIERTTRSCELTEAGRTYLPHARRLLDDAAEAERSVRGDAAQLQGIVSISAPGAFGRTFLAPYLPEFRRQYPRLCVSLKLSAVRADVAGRESDVAVRIGPVVDPRLGVRRLGQVDFALVATPAYLRERPAPGEPAQLADHDIVELRPPAQERRLELHRGGRSRSVRYVLAVEVDDPDAARAICLAGGGVAALPRFLVEEDLRRGRLVRVLEEWAPMPAPVHVLVDPAVPVSAGVAAYVDFVFDTVGRSQPWELPR